MENRTSLGGVAKGEGSENAVTAALESKAAASQMTAALSFFRIASPQRILLVRIAHT